MHFLLCRYLSCKTLHLQVYLQLHDHPVAETEAAEEINTGESTPLCHFLFRLQQKRLLRRPDVSRGNMVALERGKEAARKCGSADLPPFAGNHFEFACSDALL